MTIPSDQKQIYLNTEMASRLAGIDIGSNSVRLLVAEVFRGSSYRILDEEREPTRLARSISSDGELDKEAMARTLEALATFKQIAAGYQVSALRTIATCAVREATNGSEFCQQIQKEVGLSVEIISGEREARLAFSSVQHAFDLNGKNIVIADIGGGSTEIVFATGSLVESIFSTPLGAVRLTERCGIGSGVDGIEFQRGLIKLNKEINGCLKRETSRPLFAPHFLVGSGGTFTTLAELVMASKKEADIPVAGYKVSHAELRHLLDQLKKMSLRSRKSMAGMSSDRADIIIAGLSIIDGLLKRFRVNTILVHTRGVRDGLIREMVDEHFGGETNDPDESERAVERLAETCSGELEHGRTVAALAVRIYDQLASSLKLLPDDRKLLETAARLQDVGYVINYDQHHKHSYHLIRNSRLPGILGPDLEMIANIARYHRGAFPKKKHQNFSRLSSDDQHRVRSMAAILRLAGGLDRSRSQQVKDVLASIDNDGANLVVVSDANPQVDIWGAERRTDLFEKVFDMPVRIRWAGMEKEHTSSSD